MCRAGQLHALGATGSTAFPEDNPFANTFGAVREIWAFGFRNPYRFSFDSKTGELYVGDVGQNDIEEVDIVRKGGNYAWNCKEGTAFFYINGSVPDDGFADESPNRPQRPGDCRSGARPFIEPIAQYDLHREGHSVIGGHVYHGSRVPALRGKYVFADFALLFKFPFGPHDYGRLFTMSARGDRTAAAMTTSCAESASSWSCPAARCRSPSWAWARMRAGKFT